LLSIQRARTTLRAGVEGIKTWAKIASTDETRKEQCESLEETLQALIPSVQRLVDDVTNHLDKISKVERQLAVGAQFGEK
jgi:hypothetical protein